MNRWNGRPGIVAVIILAVFLSTIFLAGNGHGDPVVDETQNIVPPRMAATIVGTRRAVSPRATEGAAESQIPIFSFLDPNSKFPPSSPPAGNAPSNHPEIIQKMQTLQVPFIANEGQVDECVAFYAKTFGGTVFVTKNGEIVYSLPSGRDVPGGASQESERGWRQGRREAEGQGFDGCAPDGRLMGLRVDDATKGRDTGRRVPTVNLCENTAGRVATAAARRDTASRVPGVALKEEFVGARVSGIRGEGESVTKISYFKGNDPSLWRSNISTYELVNLGEIYEGVELKLKAHGNNVEKLLYVKPGASPEQIKIRLSGLQPAEGKGQQPPESPFIKGEVQTPRRGVSTKSRARGLSVNEDVAPTFMVGSRSGGGLWINEEGQLEAETALGTVKFTKPVAYQEIDGKRVAVAVEYSIMENEIHRKGAKGAEERSEKHISHKDTKNTKEGIPGGMDKPCLSVPSPENEALKYENDVTCNFDGFDGFASLNPSYPSPNPNSEFQIPKSEYCFTVASYDKTKYLIIDPLLASTFLGGSGYEGGVMEGEISLTLDTSGNVYVTGNTGSSDFPTTSGAYDIGVKLRQ